MKTTTLHDKILELYIRKENPDKVSLHRTVENYLKHRYPEGKIQKVVDDMLAKYNFEEEAREVRRRNKLNSYIDSMVLSRIRDSFKSSNSFDIDDLDEMKFKALVKQVILNFGYEVLFIPKNHLSSLDIIVHRGDVKVAILAVKCATNCNVGLRSVRQLKYMAHHYNCEQAILISSSYFEPDAAEEARKLGITLLDREKFLPLVQDLIDNRRQEEKQFLVSGLTTSKDTIFLEGQIKSPKTKVQLSFIKYFVDPQSQHLIFEGELYNNGKRPVSGLTVFIKIFNREGECISQRNAAAENEDLNSKETTPFKLVFHEILQSDWKSICRYELKLEYSNVYVAD